MAAQDRIREPRWYGIPGRVLLVTFLGTLLSFAITLLVSIVGLVTTARFHGTTSDMRFAYRHIAFPAAMAAGSIVLVLSLVMEIRHYRHARSLAGIARASR